MGVSSGSKTVFVSGEEFGSVFFNILWCNDPQRSLHKLLKNKQMQVITFSENNTADLYSTVETSISMLST